MSSSSSRVDELRASLQELAARHCLQKARLLRVLRERDELRARVVQYDCAALLPGSSESCGECEHCELLRLQRLCGEAPRRRG